MAANDSTLSERVLFRTGCVRKVVDFKDENREDPLMMCLSRAEALTDVLIEAIFESRDAVDERGRQRISQVQSDLAYLMLDCIREAKHCGR